jgi:hypothetical protein
MELDSADFEVEIALLPVAAAGRTTSVSSGYRPNHKHPLTGEYFMGQFTVDGSVAPGGTARAHLHVMALPAQIEAIRAFGSWTIWEGPHHVGSVRIVG